jgi:hypothetical protein
MKCTVAPVKAVNVEETKTVSFSGISVDFLNLSKIREIYLEKSAKVTHLVADLILFLPDAQADGNALQLTAEEEKREVNVVLI